MGPLKIRKPSAILFDIIGTATKSHFIEQILFAYIRMNVKTYLENYWDNSVLQHDVKMLREQAKKDKPPGKIPDEGADPESIRSAVAEYAIKSLEELKDNEALTQFKFHILFDGYTKGAIETPVYTDVAIAIRHWAIDDNIQLYVFSNGWCEATKRYLQKTNHGDMNLLIAGHFDTMEGPLTDAATYKKVLKQVKHPAEDVLFLTHSGAEGRTAKKAGLSVVLIMTHRRDLTKLTAEEKKEMPYIRSFNELIFTGDAPKACQLDGSSVVDDEDDDKDKNSKSNKSAKSNAPKSKDSSKTSSSSTTSAKSKSSTAGGSKSKSSSEAGLSNEFSGAKSKSAAAASSKPKSKSSAGSSAKSSLTKPSSKKSITSSTSGTSTAASKAKSKSKSQVSNSGQANKSKSSPDATSKSKSSTGSATSSAAAAKGSKKSKSKASSSNGGASGSSAGSKDGDAGGSSSGSKDGGASSASKN